MQKMGFRNTGHTDQKRILSILDRATRKHHGDIGIWMQYINFARRQKANKKLTQILTSVLRLHPTKPALWIYAANYALEERSDIAEARNFMQRGLRFCKNSRSLWLEYAKLEMVYISRIAARGRVLGLHEPHSDEPDQIGDVQKLPVVAEDFEDPNIDFDVPIDKTVLAELSSTPVLSGAIPTAIFDAAMKQFHGDSTFGQSFFDIIASFQKAPCGTKILQHVMDGLRSVAPNSPQTLACFIQQPTVGVGSTSATFPDAISTSLDRLKSSMEIISMGTKRVACSRCLLAHRIIQWILRYLDLDDMDPDVALALFATLKRTWDQYLTDLEDEPGISADEFRALFEQLKGQGFEKLATMAVGVGSRIWPQDERFLAPV